MATGFPKNDAVFVGRVYETRQDINCEVVIEPVEILKGTLAPGLVTINECRGASVLEPNPRVPPPFVVGELDVFYGTHDRYGTARRSYASRCPSCTREDRIRHYREVAAYWQENLTAEQRSRHLVDLLRDGDPVLKNIALTLLAYERRNHDATILAPVLVEEAEQLTERRTWQQIGVFAQARDYVEYLERKTGKASAASLRARLEATAVRLGPDTVKKLHENKPPPTRNR